MAKLRKLPIEELRRRTFKYPVEYFSFIGEADLAVLKYRELIEKKDLINLREQWNRLRKCFRNLEIKAGHRGRPLIMDYFEGYELNLKVLSERDKESLVR